MKMLVNKYSLSPDELPEEQISERMTHDTENMKQHPSGEGNKSVPLTVIVTTLNEEASIELCLNRILAALPAGAEVLIVDGGTDRTGEIVQRIAAEQAAVKYIRNENDRGKGHAVHVGMKAGRGEIYLQIDADLQFLPEEMSKLLAPIQSGNADLVLGSRFMKDSVRRPGSTTPLRTFGNVTTSLFASVLTGRYMTDVLAGMKAWNRNVLDQIDLRCEGVSYDAELPVKTALAGLRVIDVPVTTDARAGGHSAVHVVRDGLRILRDITRFRWGA